MRGQWFMRVLAGGVTTLALGGAADAGEPGGKSAAAASSAAAAPTPIIPTLPVEKHRLGNGLTVLLSEDHRLPIVAVEIRYLVGSANERHGRSGFAHLFEHIMFQGSAHHDREYFAPYESIGGEVNGTTNTDRTNFFEQVPSQYLELALWMESDRMENLLPALTVEKVENQRSVVLNERRQRYENTPYGMFWEYLQERTYPAGHPYRHTTIGSPEDLNAATLDDVRSFFGEYYVPANAIVTVTGDLDPKRTLALIEHYFGSIPAGERAPAPTPEPFRTPAAHHVYQDKVTYPRVYFVWNTPALFAAGDAAMDVLASVLADGKTSRLYEPLVRAKGAVAQEVSAYQVSRALGSSFVVEAQAAAGVSTDVLAKHLLEALERALGAPPTEDELQRAVNGWQKAFFMRLQGLVERAELLSTYEHATGTPDYLATDVGRYTRLTAADVFEAQRAYLDVKDFVRIDIEPAKPAEAAAPANEKGAER